jgi:DNA helicase-2/ATP-dependent DNA helicase PcrA
MQPSPRQQAIYDSWENEDYNLLINAVAGSGKTTTILEVLKRCEYKTLFLAFNKSIQEEIQAKITSRNLVQGKAMTIHSLGLSAIKKNFNFKVVKGKNWELLKRVEKKFSRIWSRMEFMDRLRLGYSLMDMNDVSRLFLTNDIPEIERYMFTMDKAVARHRELDIIWEYWVELRDDSYRGRYIEIDFVDMIYLPVEKDLKIPIDPYYLMVDECQDLNLCQHKLIDKLISQTVSKWVAVGDRNQAIYGFSGASGTSFDLFLQKDNVKEMPLDVCYRCPPNIVEEANKVFDVMEAFQEEDGVVARVDVPQDVKPNSMVICRNTSPLIKLFFELISLGKPAYIKGEDIIGSITKFLKPYSNMSLVRATMEMEEKLATLVNEEGADSYPVFKFKENLDNFKLTALNLADNNGTVKGLLLEIERIFEVKQNAITLCTIHKSKGLEADVVYILNEELIPSKFAVSPQQRLQEKNLKYVARTRAKKEMYYLSI